MAVIAIDEWRAQSLDEVLDWSPSNVLREFRALVNKPPLRSVVADIHPEAACMLLREANTKNRPMSMQYISMLGELFDLTAAGVTGDTIKVGDSGRLLDGQHRLEMASRAKVPFRTHIVFGLDDAVFDIIDQGRRRTGADVLAIDMIPNSVQTANAVRWVYLMAGVLKGEGGTTKSKANLKRFSPRGVRKLVKGPLAQLPQYAAHGARVSRAFKFPGSMVQALVFLIAQHDPKLAERFVSDWIAGSRDGPAKSFDVMQSRINGIRAQNNGRVARMLLGAFAVTAFNYWKAGQIAPARAFSWHKGISFPTLALPLPKLP